MTIASESAFLLDIHKRLLTRYDIDRWHWQDDTPALDICLGAILVQHTAWTNVEKALANLRAFFLKPERSSAPERSRRPALSRAEGPKSSRPQPGAPFTLEDIAALSEDVLAAIIRPVGTPLTKARRLHAFAAFALNAGGLATLLRQPSAELRAGLLATPGIGPETADVILLYAARYPAIVHDAYTQRFFRRLGFGPERDGYDRWQAWLEARTSAAGAFRRAHHAAITVHCKETCRARPLCAACPLLDLCAFANNRSATQS
jgi:endonuclease-3 related protein